MPSDARHPVKITLDQLRSVWARELQAAPSVPKFLEEGAQWTLATAASTLPFQWARHLAAETSNKLFAYSEFQRFRRESFKPNAAVGPLSPDPYTSIWRAEGLGARIADTQSSTPASLANCCASSNLSPSYQIPIHTGGGLSLAEAVLKEHLRPGKELAIGKMLSELYASIEQKAEPGLQNPVFEALGLILQTMHPELLNPVADYIKTHDLTCFQLLWHGAGRGYYFDPLQVVLPSSIRIRTYLSDTDDAGLNRLSGYAWAITLVNMRSPKAAAAIIADLPLGHKRSLAAAADGVSAAALLWLAMTNDNESLANFKQALTNNKLFTSPSLPAVFADAIAKRTAIHPTSAEELGALFAYDPDALPSE